MSTCVKILYDLSVSVFAYGVCEHDDRLVRVLGAGYKLQQLSQLENLLSHYKASRYSVAEKSTLQQTIKLAFDMLNDQVDRLDVTEVDDNDDDCGSDDCVSVNIACVKFCLE